MTISIKLAWDSGVSDGNPGEGRVRVNATDPRNATHILVNALDRNEAELSDLLATFKQGDVLGLDRDGANGRIVAWVIGQVVHAGEYYKIPASIRSVDGAFAAHDLVTLHRLEEKDSAPAQPPAVVDHPAPIAVAVQAAPSVAHDDLRALADGMLVMAETINDLKRRVATLEQDMEAFGNVRVVDKIMVRS